MILTDLSLLDPAMQPGVRRALRRGPEIGIPLIVLETRRELATQMAYYARGRASAELVKAYFRACRLWPLTTAEAEIISTQTLYSKHIEGLAVDMAPALPNGKPWWNAPDDVWTRFYDLVESECGLDACFAGQWNAWKWDRPHFEYHHAVQEAD